jgi:hypothetical protein
MMRHDVPCVFVVMCNVPQCGCPYWRWSSPEQAGRESDEATNGPSPSQ